MLNPDLSIMYNAIIFISNGRIDKVETSTNDIGEYQAEMIYGHGKLAMPGMVDAHTHSAQQFLRGVWWMNYR